MPYKAFPENDEYCVYKLSADDTKTGASLGCHRTMAEANKQVAALYASETKEADMSEDLTEQADNTKETKMLGLPPGIVSFADLDAFVEAQEAIGMIEDITSAFGMLAQNILMGDAPDKGIALANLAKEYAQKVVDETKETEDNEKAVWSTAFVNNLPDTSFLFIEGGGKKDEEGKTTPRSLRHFPYKDASGKVDLPHLRNAIARIPQSNAPGLNKTALQARARKILADTQKELDEDKWFNKLLNRVKEALGLKQDEKAQDDFLIWKEADGQYHWLAVYSNNIRDRDNPPEIISSKSHQRFVEMVDKGLYPLPELWLWHVKEWKFGQATAVAYDDNGFSVATGTVDRNDEAEAIAKWLQPRKDILVSHGMPPQSIKRDEADNTVIIEHQTKEISPLFDFAAANSVTGFNLLDKEASMAIPKHKKDEFVERGLSEEVLNKLEETNAEAAKETEHLEKKEGEQQPQQDSGEQQETPESQGEQAVTRQEVAETIAEVVKPLVEQVKSLISEVKELRKDDEVKIAEKAAATPKASLQDLTWESIFGKENQVDGRTTLAKAKPAETQANEEDWFIRSWVKGGK